MPTPPTPPTYWWLTVRIDACRTRDERVAAASGDDAVRMWRELHPNVEVIHVRPVPELVDIELEHMSINNNNHDPTREPASVVGEPSDEELLATLDRATATFPPRHPEAEALNAVEYPLALELRKARAVLARFGHHSPDATKMVGPGPSIEAVGSLIAWLSEQACQAADAGQPTDAGMLTWAAQVIGERVDEDAPAPMAARDVAELVAWLRGAIWDRTRQALATSAADMLVRLCSSWFVQTVEQVQQLAPVPVAERLPRPTVRSVAMTDTTNRLPLSPAAQAVMMAATNGNINVVNDPVYRQCIAAALRAAVGQVRTDPNLKRHIAATMAEMLTLDKILAVATELEDAND